MNPLLLKSRLSLMGKYIQNKQRVAPFSENSKLLKRWGLLFFALIAFNIATWGQTTFTWNGGSNNWNNAASWVKVETSTSTWPGQNAGQNDIVIINSTGTVTINTSFNNNSVQNVTINSGAVTSDGTNGRICNINGDLAIANGASFNFNRLTVNITGTSTINGTITDGNGNGSNNFSGLVTISSTGSIATGNNSNFTFGGGIANDGTINQTGTGTVTLTANQTFSGTGSITFTGAVTINNNFNVTSTTTINIAGLLNGLNGASTWTNGTNSTLNYSNATQPMGTGVLTATASGNTVNYSAGVAQSIKAITYNNLSVSGSNVKTITLNNITVSNNLSIQGTATLDCVGWQINGNPTGILTMASGTALLLGSGASANNISFPTNFSSDLITLDPASTVEYRANTATQVISAVPTYGNLTVTTGATNVVKSASGNILVNGNLTLTDGAGSVGISFGVTPSTKTIKGNITGNGDIDMSTGSVAHTLNIGGNFTNSGTFTQGTSTVNYNGVDQTVRGGITYYNLTLSNSGTKTLGNDITISNNLYTTGTATFATDTRTVTGNATGTFIMDAGTSLALGNTASATGGAFPTLFTNANINFGIGSTVIYQSNGAQTISAAPGTKYQNLTLATSGTKTLANAITVNGNLSVQGTATLASDIYQLTGNATGSFTMESGTNLTLGNAGSATATAFPTVFTTDNINLNPSSTVTYQSTGAQIISVTPTYGNLTVSTGGAKTATGTLNIAGNLTVNAGSLNYGATITTVNLSGNLSGAGTINMSGLAHILNLGGASNAIGALTTTASGSFVNYNRSGDQQVFSSANYRNLTISESGIKTMQGATTVNNNLYITGTATFATDANTITGSTGTFTMDEGTTFTLGTKGSATNVAWPTFSGGYSLNSNSTVIYQANVNTQAINTSPIYGNLTITTGATSLTKTTSAGNLNVTGNLNLINGTGTITLAFESSAVRTNSILGDISGNGTLNMAGAAHILNIGGDNLHSGTFTPANGTVSYNGTNKNQLVRGVPYFNLTVSGGGTKYLGGATSVAATGAFTLGGAILQLGNFDFSILNTGIAAISGTPSATNMIETNSTGLLIKYGTAAGAGLNIVYPIGSGGYYSPMNVTAFARIGGGNTVSVRCQYLNQGASTLKKRWYVASTYTGITATVRFTYNNPQEVNGTQSLYTPWYNNGAWAAPGAPTGAGANPFGGTNGLVGQWTAGQTAPTAIGSTTYYSYQSGNWDRATTWTTDPSGTLWVDGYVPVAGDNVVILNGRTVTATCNTISLANLEIREGGILNTGSTTGHNFGTVTGKGTLKLATATFPSGTFTSFVSATGGTVELNYNSSGLNIGSFTTPANTFNNLIVNLTSPSYIAIQNSTPLTINGNLTIQSGEMQISSATIKTTTITGDVYVGTNGSITISAAANINHTFTVKGDFTIDGTVDFYSGTIPDYSGANYGLSSHADVVFNNSTKDQNLLCNGVSEFYRININKGADWTYILNIDANNSSNFKLYGRNNRTNYTSDGTPNPNALGLEVGTLRLGSNIVIPSLTSLAYTVSDQAQLWLDGCSLSFTTVPASVEGFFVYGKVKFSSNCTADFSAPNRYGFITREASEVEIISGNITTTCFRTSVYVGTHRGAFKMYGGTLTITAFDNTGDADEHASFSIPYPDNVFIMTDGVIDIQQPNNGGGTAQNFSLMLGMQPKNASVLGGTILINTTPRVAYINSTVPLNNLTIYGTTNSAQVRRNTSFAALNTALPLYISGDFTLQNSTHFNNTQNVSVYIGGNFNIPNGTTYTPGNNTTTFNGTGAQVYNNDGVVTNGLYNLTFSNLSNTTLSKNLIVRNQLSVDTAARFDDNGFTVSVLGNIINSGICAGQTTSGGIQLLGTANQTIGGDGNGIFNHLILNKTYGSTSLTANQSFTGNIRLASASAILDIGVYNISLSAVSNFYDAFAGTTQVFSNTKMVRTAGNQSDGGVTKTFSNTSLYRYPIGTNTDYTPAEIQFTSTPTNYGSVTVRPVAVIHPLVQNSTNALKYYWKVETSSSFTGIPPNSVLHRYYYTEPGMINGDETTFRPSSYRPTEWTVINDPFEVYDAASPSYIQYNNVSYVTGEYTCGDINAFTGLTIYYSRNAAPNIGTTGADWNTNTTWSTDQALKHDGDALGANIPNDRHNCVFVIGDGTVSHKLNIANNGILTGNLIINENSTLDLVATNGHSFGSSPDNKVTGTGKLRIARSDYFPNGDWGFFLDDEGGTVEYYTIATGTFNLPTQYTLPTTSVANIDHYNNLSILPYDGSTIILPNRNQTIYGNIAVGYNGTTTTNCLTQLSNSSSTSYTLTVKGNLNINAYGRLQYPNINSIPQNISVEGDITLDNNGVFNVAGTNGGANTLISQGNITNNGTINLRVTANQYCNVTFFGSANREINGTPTQTSFNNINVNKGIDRNSVIDVNISNTNFSIGGTLSLTNGTFRVTSAVDLTLSTGVFNIPITGCLSANGGTIRVATANANASDLTLDGRLEVLNGAIYVGDINNTGVNNDIEYSSGGIPEVRVAGTGNLYVNGQVRRGVIINTGSLNYYQNGGTVTVYGRAANNVRSMFEVLNAGSRFEMTGGTLKIANSFNDAGYANGYSDFYVTPEHDSITAGTIQIGMAGITPAGTQYNLVSSCSQYSLTVDAIANLAANLRVYPLILKGNLTISGTTAYFAANGLDVTINGELVNGNTTVTTGVNNGGYRAVSSTPSTQVTTFNGSSKQLISGTGTNLTNFANVVINNTGSASSRVKTNYDANVRINGNLTITQGTLVDSLNTITVTGNINNNGTHASKGATGGITMSNTTKQYISGNGFGIFGSITIDNAAGVDMIDNSTINDRLYFNNGWLYIDDYLLTLGEQATVNANGGFLSNRQIILNGVLSDQGVKKIFPAVVTPSTYSFTFPVGLSGKYTPATFTFTDNDVNTGYIIVKPINALHKSVLTPPVNYIPYYWGVVSANFNTYTVSHQYTYVDADIKGTESSYAAQRYVVATNTWYNLSVLGQGSITTGSNAINVTNQSYIDGEYTAGEPYTPQEELYSTGNLDWNNLTLWYKSSDNTACSCVPNGNPVIISTGNTVTVTADGANVYSALINGTLDVGNTTFHDLGHVNGPGKLKLAPSIDGMFVFPGGEYDLFLANSLSTVEFTGTSNGTLPLKPGNYYKPYQNVILSSTGIKYMSAENFRALGDLTIQNGAKLNNSLYNKNLSLYSDWIDNNSTTAGFTAGKGTVIFEGLAAQVFNIGANITENFYNYTINNSNGVSFSGLGDIGLTNYLYLTNGNITTSSSNALTLNNTSPNVVFGGSSSSFVNGPLHKKILNGSSFTFPVGKTGPPNRFGYVSVLGTSTIGTKTWYTEYFNQNPHPLYDTSMRVDPISMVSGNEYWNVVGPTGGKANVRVRWDEYSGGIIGSTLAARQKLRIVEWNGTSWQSVGQTIVDNGQTSGTITSSPPVNLDNHVFTIGITSIPSARFASGSDITICNNGQQASLVIIFAGPSSTSFSFTYTINGLNATNVTNVTSPYTLKLDGPTSFGNTPGTYTVAITDVWDNTNTHGIVRSPSQRNVIVNAVPTATITGDFSVGTGETIPYSTTTDAASYSWSLYNNYGTPTTYSGVPPYNVTWNTAGNDSIILIKTHTNGCQVRAHEYVTITTIPSPSITGNANVCSGATENYFTTNNIGNSYTWTVTGGTITSGAGTYQISVQWGAVANNRSVSVTECSDPPTNIICGNANLTVNVGLQPNTSRVIDEQSVTVCENGSAQIIVRSSENNVRYQIRTEPGDVLSGSPVTGDGNDITLTSAALSTLGTNDFNILAYTEPPFNCQAVQVDLASVEVVAAPIAPTAFDQSHCNGSTVVNLASTPPAGCVTDWYSTLTGGTALAGSTALVNTIYYAESRNTTTGCVSLTRTPVTVTIYPSTTVTVSGLVTGSPICDGDLVQISIVFTGAPPFDFTMEDGQGHSWSETGINALSGAGYTYTIPSAYTVWISPTIPTTYIYTITAASDSNGCSATSISGSATIDVYKNPETGSIYHIPNSFSF